MPSISPKLLRHPDVFLATGFGSGLSPVAPGTVGSMAGLLLFVPLNDSTWSLLAICLASFMLGIWICDLASERLGEHDHGGIVWDEFVGIWITMLWIPVTLTNLVLAFIFFRLFDILKPWPISYLDKRIQGGLGIMIDDVIAGLFAAVCVRITLDFL